MKPELTQTQQMRLEEGGWREIISKYTFTSIDAMGKCSKSNLCPEMHLIRSMLEFGKCHEFEKKALRLLTCFVFFFQDAGIPLITPKICATNVSFSLLFLPSFMRASYQPSDSLRSQSINLWILCTVYPVHSYLKGGYHHPLDKSPSTG